jgi:hypothetical protein
VPQWAPRVAPGSSALRPSQLTNPGSAGTSGWVNGEQCKTQGLSLTQYITSFRAWWVVRRGAWWVVHRSAASHGYSHRPLSIAVGV